MSDHVEIIKKPTDDLMGRFLTFYIGETIYGIGLSNVIEIISVQSFTRIPGVPDNIKGIVNLRGKIVPVIDVRLKFGLIEKIYDDKTCIVVVNFDDMNMGLIVDQVSEVTASADESLSDLPEFNRQSSSSFLESIGKIGSNLVLNIDCRRFFYDEHPPLGIEIASGKIERNAPV